LRQQDPSAIVWSSLVVVATVARPQGRRGEVIVAPATDFPDERFAPGSVVYARRGEAPEPLTITSSRAHDGRWVLGFEGIGSIEDAETLRGLELKVAEESLHQLEAGAYYVHDLVGCRVETTAGGNVGVVARVEFGAGGAALVVKDDDGEVMIPLVDAFCRSVDTAGKRIVVDPPPGLLELRVKT